MHQHSGSKQRIIEGLGLIVDEAKSAAKEGMRRSKVDYFGENLKETIDGVLSARDKVVMVRLNKESAARLDELIEAELVSSRSEAAAFLIGEGINKRQPLFNQISSKIKEIRKMKDELRDLIVRKPTE